MKSIFLTLLVITTLHLSSCTKNNEIVKQDPEEPETNAKLENTCTFSVDGMDYSLSELWTFGWGNADTTKGISKDSILFFRSFGLHSRSTDTSYASAKFFFIKKYLISSLVSNKSGYIYPRNETDVFSEPYFTYSTDWEREYRMGGIAMELTVGKLGAFTTYSRRSRREPTSITPQSHKDSKFTIVKFERIEDHGCMLEAKFEGTIFDMNETSRKLENGFLRIFFYDNPIASYNPSN